VLLLVPGEKNLGGIQCRVVAAAAALSSAAASRSLVVVLGGRLLLLWLLSLLLQLSWRVKISFLVHRQVSPSQTTKGTSSSATTRIEIAFPIDAKISEAFVRFGAASSSENFGSTGRSSGRRRSSSSSSAGVLVLAIVLAIVLAVISSWFLAFQRIKISVLVHAEIPSSKRNGNRNEIVNGSCCCCTRRGSSSRSRSSIVRRRRRVSRQQRGVEISFWIDQQSSRSSSRCSR